MAVAVALATAAVRAQDWPQRPVKILVPFAAGGNADVVARIVAQRLSDGFGHQFVVDNRPGGSGAMAAEATARAPADGHTLFLANAPVMAIAPAVAKTAYNPVKDFAPISVIGSNPLVLVVHPGVPATTLREFIDHVGRQNGTLNYVATGAGSITHLTMALFLRRAGLQMTPVMYKGGGAPALADVLAGHVPVYFANLSVVMPYATTGALRFLAVSGDRRSPQIPDVPTVAEAGFPGFKAIAWNGLVAPAATPRAIVDRLAREVMAAVREPQMADRLIGSGIDPLGNSPEEFSAMMAADIAQWAEAVKMAGVREE